MNASTEAELPEIVKTFTAIESHLDSGRWAEISRTQDGYSMQIMPKSAHSEEQARTSAVSRTGPNAYKEVVEAAREELGLYGRHEPLVGVLDEHLRNLSSSISTVRNRINAGEVHAAIAEYTQDKIANALDSIRDGKQDVPYDIQDCLGYGNDIGQNVLVFLEHLDELQNEVDLTVSELSTYGDLSSERVGKLIETMYSGLIEVSVPGLGQGAAERWFAPEIVRDAGLFLRDLPTKTRDAKAQQDHEDAPWGNETFGPYDVETEALAFLEESLESYDDSPWEYGAFGPYIDDVIRELNGERPDRGMTP